MTLPFPQTSEPVPPRRRRWGRVVLLVFLAGTSALGWHFYTGHRAVRRLGEVGFVESEAWLGARVWAAARQDWRMVFNSGTWKSRPSEWWLGGAKARGLRNLDAVAPALRRVNPERITIHECSALENVDGLKGLTGLQALDLHYCTALQNVDGLKGLTSLRTLDLSFCYTLQKVDGLKGLTSLKTLDLRACYALQNVDGLKGLAGLQTLELTTCVTLQNVDGLKGLTGLQTLDLRVCSALQNVDGLKGLTGLQTLYLQDCAKIPAPDLRELSAALPKTKIYFDYYRSRLPPQ